jgi:uncharacterized protein YbjT (DUF2867 family)
MPFRRSVAAGGGAVRILVTGATGRLGRLLVPELERAGHEVRAGSRNGPWAHDLATGAGLAAAVDGVDAVAHLASAAFGNTRDVDVRGTARLVDAARAAGVGHVLFTSIVGIHRIPLAYYRAKLDAEAVIAEGNVPHTIVRITQFHLFLRQMVENLLRWPVVIAPRGVTLQPIDEHVAAAAVCDLLAAGPGGRVDDLGGPEVIELSEAVRRVSGARRRWVITRGIPTVGALRSLRSGALCLEGGRTLGDPFH